jgi:DNA-binding FadR family transcriptional regulator
MTANDLLSDGYCLSDMAYERLVSVVIGGEFPVNSRLPPEIELARRIGVSRPVLRIALIRLRADGILKSRRGSGNYVIRQPHRSVLRLVELSQISNIQDCFKFRIGVEGESAYYAAINLSKSVLVKIDNALLSLAEAGKNKVSGVHSDFEFHMNIAQASGNQYFVSSLAAIREQFVFSISITHDLSLHRSRDRLLTVQGEHQTIRDAIARAEPEEARVAMRTHLENARRRLFEGDLER